MRTALKRKTGGGKNESEIIAFRLKHTVNFVLLNEAEIKAASDAN